MSIFLRMRSGLLAPSLSLALAGGLPAVVAVPSSARAGEAPDVGQLLARHRQAMGGMEAWERLKTLRIRSRNDDQERLLVWQAPDSLHVSEKDLAYTGKTLVRATRAGKGWKVDPFRGDDRPQAMTAEQVKAFIAEHPPGSPLLRAPESAVRWLGSEGFHAIRVHRLRLDGPGGPLEVLLGAEDHLVHGVRRDVPAPFGGKRRVEVVYGDHRPVQGLVFPHLVGDVRRTVEVDVAVDDSLFEPP